MQGGRTLILIMQICEMRCLLEDENCWLSRACYLNILQLYELSRKRQIQKSEINKHEINEV